MTRTSHRPEDELPLSPAVFHILLSLAHEERHGYGIMQDVKARTDGKIRLAPGTLYGAVKRLLEQGIIEETDERPDLALNDERRRYYRLTEFGLQVLTAEAARMAELVRQAQHKQLLPGPAADPLTGNV